MYCFVLRGNVCYCVVLLTGQDHFPTRALARQFQRTRYQFWIFHLLADALNSWRWLVGYVTKSESDRTEKKSHTSRLNHHHCHSINHHNHHPPHPQNQNHQEIPTDKKVFHNPSSWSPLGSDTKGWRGGLSNSHGILFNFPPKSTFKCKVDGIQQTSTFSVFHDCNITIAS